VVIKKSYEADINNDIPGLDRLLKHKQKLRKLWQETRDPACKTAVNCVSKAIKKMTHKKALERWETKIGNAEITHLRNPFLRRMDHVRQLLFMVIQVISSIRESQCNC
jgi:hypothetical protein